MDGPIYEGLGAPYGEYLYQRPERELREGGWGEPVDMRDRFFDDPGFYAGLAFGGLVADRDRKGSLVPTIMSEADLTELRSVARVLCDQSAPAVCAVKNLQNFIIRTGFKYIVRSAPGIPAHESLIAAVQQVLDRFRKDNRFDGDYDRELERRKVRDGEWFLALYPTGDGRALLRTIEPEMVREPRDPRAIEDMIGWTAEDLACDWSYGIQTKANDIQTVYGYHVQWTNDPTDFDVLPAERVVHFKANVDRNIKRGLTDFYPVASSILDASKAIRNTIKGVSLQAAIAWIMEAAAGSTVAQIQSMRGNNAVSSYYDPAGPGGAPQTRYAEHYKPGTVLRVPSGQKYVSGPLGSERVPNFVNAVQMVLRFIGSRWCMPEYMISGDASNAAYASTMVAESPFVANCEAEQAYDRAVFATLMWKAVKIAAEAGLFASFGLAFEQIEQLVEIHIEPPRVAVRDANKETERNKLLVDGGVMSGKTWAAREELDYEEEQAQGAAKAAPVPTFGSLPGSGPKLPFGQPVAEEHNCPDCEARQRESHVESRRPPLLPNWIRKLANYP